MLTKRTWYTRRARRKYFICPRYHYNVGAYFGDVDFFIKSDMYRKLDGTSVQHSVVHFPNIMISRRFHIVYTIRRPNRT